MSHSMSSLSSHTSKSAFRAISSNKSSSIEEETLKYKAAALTFAKSLKPLQCIEAKEWKEVEQLSAGQVLHFFTTNLFPFEEKKNFENYFIQKCQGLHLNWEHDFTVLEHQKMIKFTQAFCLLAHRNMEQNAQRSKTEKHEKC